MRFALAVAHPGHELLVHHWMEQHRPLYSCLTDGSGSTGASRLGSTARLLRDLETPSSPIFGRFTDRDLYRLMLDRRTDVFTALRDELAEVLIAADVTTIAGDAMEGFNPSHDLCRVLIDAAVARTGRDIENLQFALDGISTGDATECIALDENALDRKLRAARNYPEMRGEVESQIERSGTSAFATEVLYRSDASQQMNDFLRTPPRFETFGEARVKEGRYAEVIRYREHLLPIIDAIHV